MDPIIALDFETPFDKAHGVKIQGNVGYARIAPPFLVSLYCPELELEFVGDPVNAPWRLVHGRALVAHNASFDSAVFETSRDVHGLIPKSIEPALWHCSADLAAYCGLGRSLKSAVKNAFGVDLTKTVRDKAKGKTWRQDFTAEQQADFRKYCLADAKWSYQLWRKYSGDWPAEEQTFAAIIRRRANQGVAIDQAALAAGLERLEELRDQAQDDIPWSGSKPSLSIKVVREFCQAHEIPAPQSLAENSEAARSWEAHYGNQYPIIGAIRAYRKSNMYLRKLQSIANRLLPNGRMCFGLKYHGADSTGRLAGTDGWNIQNLPREPFEGVDVRKLLVAGPDRKFAIADFNAIEPRIIAWLGRNTVLLSMLKAGNNIYEADARIAGLWRGEPDTLKKSQPHLYQVQKAATLGVGYGMGTERFREAARAQLGLDIDPDKARAIIAGWHARNPGVRKLWDKLELSLAKAFFRGESLCLTLPSGRALTYCAIQKMNGRFTAQPSLEPRRKTYWGAVLFENIVQATARDLLRDAVCALEELGVPVIFTAHDEIVAEVPLDFDAGLIERTMLLPPKWAPDLPLAIEISETQAYMK
jgi:hypothetical protein